MMKNLCMLASFWLLMVSLAQGQNCPEYDQLIKEGQQFKQRRLYHKALKSYNAARLCSPNKATIVEKYIDDLFTAIEHEKDEAVAAVTARAKAETNIQQMADLMGKITEAIQPEKTVGIVGFATIEHDLYKILLPYHQYLFKNATKLDKPWQSAMAHLRVGTSLEDVNTVQSEQELKTAFNEAKAATMVLLAQKKSIPNELHRCLIDAADFYAWGLMNRKEIAQAQGVLFTAKTLTEQEAIQESSDLVNSHAKLENALSRLFQEKKQYKEALRYQTRAVELAREAVAIDKENLNYKSTLAVYLRNLSNTSDSLMKEEELSVLKIEGCTLAKEVDNTEGSGVVAMKTVMSCIHYESYALVSQKKTEQAISNLQQAVNRLDKIIHLDPTNTSYYLHRAHLTMRLSDIEMGRKNETLQFSYLKAVTSDWLKAINGKAVVPEDVWMLKNIYESMRSTAQSFTKLEDKALFFKQIAAGIESSASTYGHVPAVGMIAADSYAQVGEYIREDKQPADSVLFYLSKSIDFSTKANLINESLVFDEQIAWFCRPYSQRLQLYCEREDTDRAMADLTSINTLFGPVLAKYPFDFWLRAAFWKAHMSVGELLIKKGKYQQAKPILEYASKWGEKDATLYLASMYREGKVGKPDTVKAAQLEKIAPGQSMKKITIPCDFDGVSFPFPFYVRDFPKDVPYKGIDDQIEWVAKARGGKVSDEVGSSFRKLQVIAWENNVSFPDLCVYALGEAQDDGTKEKLTNFNKQISAAKDSTEKLTLYTDMTALYEEKIKADSTKSIHNKDAAAAYLAYSQYLERNKKMDDALAKISRANELDPANIHVYRFATELKINHTKESVTTLTQHSDKKELLAYMYVYLKKDNKKNADLMKSKLLAQDDTPLARDQVDDIYSMFGHDIFKELFLSKPDQLTSCQAYFLAKDLQGKTNSENLIHYRNLIKIEETLLKNKPSQEGKEQLAQHYNSVVWYCLLTKQFNAANVALQQGLSYDANQLYLLGNEPHILLFTGKVKEAKEMYVKLKDKKFDEKAGFPVYKDAFLDDFAAFEKLGIIHPDLEEIKALLES